MRAALLAALLLLVAAPGARAACAAPATKACSAWFWADQVFVGKVRKVEDAAAGQGPGEVAYTLAVERPLKGKAGRMETVRGAAEGGRWPARVGDRLVVFARDGRVRATCGELDNPRDVPRVLREVDRLRKTADARIEGEMLRGASGAPVRGMQVRAEGEDGRAHGDTTDANGRFVMVVPPGRYALAAGAPLQPNERARAPLEGFEVAAGECAQFSVLVP